MRDRKTTAALLKQHLNKAAHRMKQFADRKGTERTFQVGDKVFLKLKPYNVIPYPQGILERRMVKRKTKRLHPFPCFCSLRKRNILKGKY